MSEQITKEPEKVEKIKDPKKVAAGKRLVEYHKKAKAALQKEEDTTAEEEGGWMPDISLSTALALVGITLTAVDLYFRWRKPPPAEATTEKTPPEGKKEPTPTKKKMGME